jgi:ppGpp synthetase/RelA/SpoT-type nucleotidyltranferase
VDEIDLFISRYTREYDFYEQAARLATQKLSTDLRGAGIRSIVTYRAKSIPRLEEKCRKRHKARGGYSSVDDVSADIIDGSVWPGYRCHSYGVVSVTFVKP